MGITSIRIQNYKSIKDTGEFYIKPLNVLIGPNGVGKSNFISFFKFLSSIYSRELQLYVNTSGRADNILYFGIKGSAFLSGKITFANDWQNQYEFMLVPDQAGNLVFKEEWSSHLKYGLNKNNIGSAGQLEGNVKSDTSFRTQHLRPLLYSYKIFHFHDTSVTSGMRQPCGAKDYAFLYENGSNIAAFLYRLQQTRPAEFNMIERVVQSVAPFFNKFYLVPDEVNPEQIFLRWTEKGSEKIFNAFSLSDGTLRMICLSTLLLQPDIPQTIIIDEPELGLHPFAISKLAGLLKSASSKAQIIISTQSVNLVNEFTANDIVVVERSENQTVFTRQSQESLKGWLTDYSIGQLWEKNILGGRPK